MSADITGLKLLVGYDMLVIQRPGKPQAAVTATRVGELGSKATYAVKVGDEAAEQAF